MTDEIQPEKETLLQPKKPAKKAAKKAPEKAPETTSEKVPETTSEKVPDMATLSETLEKVSAERKASEKKEKKEVEKKGPITTFHADPFQKLFSAYDENSECGKAVYAMQIERSGCLVNTSTTIGDSVVETTTFVPGVQVKDIIDNGKVVGRKLVHI